ncbi:MAG: peptidase domain-containing ABC transporter [Alphaproteobacteria bacterium]|nr:peptidase domain-containing ABC transporter [Alphaproteobacteria bacterium]MBV9371708.1 peptidase domain-containing ABC transporter [Alphaproteobacteria bacterium]MBV9902484.1 peptidase domain-containing ABC transporter [Alphaproteobacteria bacterium]
MNLFHQIRRRLPMVMQDANGECGLACIAMIAQWYGHRLDLPYLRSAFPATRQGLSLASLAQVADRLKFNARGYVVDDVQSLSRAHLPAIVHWDGNHFVVLRSVRGDRYVVHNPAGGVRTYRRAEFAQHFTGRLLELTPSSTFSAIVRERKYTLRRILELTEGLQRSLLQVCAVGVTGSLVGMLVPVLIQVALDSVVPKGDVDLLGLLAGAMFLVSLTTAVTDWLRKRITLNAGSAFFAQLTRNAVAHLFRLPLSYFETRHPGDIATRLDSVRYLSAIVTNSTASIVVDGSMLLLSGTLMFVYAPELALIVTAVFLAVILVRLLLYPSIRRHAGKALKEKSEEHSRLFDHIRAVAALKTANATRDSTARWYERLIHFVNADFRTHCIEANALLIVEIFTALGTALTLYFGVLAVITQAMSVGMLYAFLTYRAMFFERIDKIVSVMTEVAMLGQNLMRLRDFLEVDVEDGGLAIQRSVRRGLELRGVEFRAGFADRPILKDIDVAIPFSSGAMIAIEGPSGSGKTTLLKVMAGLYAPTGGQLLVDGTPLGTWGRGAYRDNIGLLLGTDKLVRGSILENVTAFSQEPDSARAEAALRICCLDDVVDQLPRQMASVVSEENGVLSSGQRRRLMLARAVYREAGLLLLDEVTSNLDAETTRRLLANLGDLDATKVLTTHDPVVLEHCSRVLRMSEGVLGEPDPRVEVWA